MYPLRERTRSLLHQKRRWLKYSAILGNAPELGTGVVSRQAVERKEATLVFHSFHSIVYELIHILGGAPITGYTF
jgi:hypothetical protein